MDITALLYLKTWGGESGEFYLRYFHLSLTNFVSIKELRPVLFGQPCAERFWLHSENSAPRETLGT